MFSKRDACTLHGLEQPRATLRTCVVSQYRTVRWDVRLARQEGCTEYVSHLTGHYFSIHSVLTSHALAELVKSAPNLQHLEIRHPAIRGLGIFSQDNAPHSEWLTNLLPSLARLEKLATLELSFPVPTRRDPKRAEELRKGYDKVVEQARKIMIARRKVEGRRRLVVRHVEAPHYDNEVDHLEDLVFEYNVEVFE